MKTEYSRPARLGRPRPPETIERDKRVVEILKENSLTRNMLREQLHQLGDSVSIQQTWLALDRLHTKGLVKKCFERGEVVWTSRVEEPCP